jgi:peptidylprolyl isomerase
MLKKKALTMGFTVMLCCATQFLQAETAPAQSEKELDIPKLSEAFGHFIGKNLKTSGMNFDVNALVKGIKDGTEGKPAPMDEKEYQDGMAALQKQALTRLGDENLAAANKFMDENKGKAGVIELEPGKLQYIIEQAGNGEAVKEHGTPTINYSGKFIDGTVFGSSKDTGGPISLPLDHTIPGFAKAIVGMKEGEKRIIFVHPERGYGTSGQLPPNSLLIFEVEVTKAETPPKPVPQPRPVAAIDSDNSMDQDEDDLDDDDDDDYRNGL